MLHADDIIRAAFPRLPPSLAARAEDEYFAYAMAVEAVLAAVATAPTSSDPVSHLRAAMQEVTDDNPEPADVRAALRRHGLRLVTEAPRFFGRGERDQTVSVVDDSGTLVAKVTASSAWPAVLKLREAAGGRRSWSSGDGEVVGGLLREAM